MTVSEPLGTSPGQPTPPSNQGLNFPPPAGSPNTFSAPIDPATLPKPTEATPPVSWDPTSNTNRMLQGVLSKRNAGGFDNNLKAGTFLLIASLLVAPIILGPAAAYCGYRSHRDGNPIGQVFAIGSLVLTVVNLFFIALVLLPKLT